MSLTTQEKKGRDRPVTCERCGTPFTCTLGGPCWCSGEDFKLPLPPQSDTSDCLCPSCLKAYAAELRAEGKGP